MRSLHERQSAQYWTTRIRTAKRITPCGKTCDETCERSSRASGRWQFWWQFVLQLGAYQCASGKGKATRKGPQVGMDTGFLRVCSWRFVSMRIRAWRGKTD